MTYSHEVEHMCVVKKGPNHGQAPIPEECFQCKFMPTCNGGCFRERFMLGYPYRCKSNIMYWNHVLKWIESKGGKLYILKGKSVEEKKAIINKILNMNT